MTTENCKESLGRKMVALITSPDIFKTIVLLVSILGACPLLGYSIAQYLKLLHVYAAVVMVFDLMGEKRILRNKGRFLLPLFCAFYLLTLLNNNNLLNLSGLSDFSYLLIALAIVYSYGQKSEKIDRITTAIFSLVVSLLNLVGIWMFFTKYFCEVPELDSFVGMYIHENRLCGLWGNPAVQGMLAYIGICLSGICCFNSKGRNRILYICLIILNVVCMLMANARAAIFSFIFLCMVLVFLVVLKGKVNLRGAVMALLVAVITALIVYSGTALIQKMISFSDVRYEYYLMNIDREYRKEYTELAETEPHVPTQTIDRDMVGLNGRGELWRVGFRLMLSRPLFGNGLNNLNHALQRIGDEEIHIAGNLHNVYLDILVAFGLAGFGCLAVFLMITFGNIKKYFRYSKGTNWNRIAMFCAAVAGFMLYGVVDSSLMFSGYPMAITFWYITSQLVNAVEIENRASGHYNPELLHLLEEKLTYKRASGKKSICFVIDSLGGGGAEQILLNVANALVENGFDVTVVTLWSNDILESKLASGVTLKTLDPFDSFFLKRVQHWINRHCMPVRFYNFLLLDRRYDYTVAFLEGLSTRVVAETRIRPGDIKYAWVHIDFRHQNWTLPFYRSQQAQIDSYDSFDKVFCVSETVRDAFVEVIGYADKAVVQYNLVETRGVLKKAEMLCPEAKPEGILLYSIGRLNHQKGYDRLLRVFAKILGTGQNCSLWILGEGNLRPVLEEQIVQLGLEKHVHLLGFQTNPFCFAAQADVFVCSSRAEGYSTVITENLLLGKPIVSTLCAGVREQLGDDEYGIVTQNDEDSLYDGIMRMLSDSSLREHYAAQAKKRSASVSYEVILREFLDLFT